MKIEKPYTDEQYADLAVFCNENGMIIVDCGDYLESVVPEKTVEEKQAEVREVRNEYLTDTDKYMLVDFPISDDEREICKVYRQYLRDYTKTPDWWESYPKTYDEWKE